MQYSVDDIVATLSVQVFHVPAGEVAAARDASGQAGEASLIQELSQRGFLADFERAFLEELSEKLIDRDGPTASRLRLGEPEGPTVAMADEAVEYLSDFRALHQSSQCLRIDGEVRYEHLKEQGRGGMGRVLSVWDRRMAREVALKELLPDTVARRGSDPDTGVARQRVIARFLKEAQVTGRLQHPGIIPVHEIGERADGTLYYTMKFVRGKTLRQAIRDAQTLEERMDLLPHYVDMCQAMAYAHAHGVIHRDLKPSNVMIGEFGETLVIDWGLAKETDSAEETGENGAGPVITSERNSPGLTMDGQLIGTPHYMAPEQAAGQHHALDARTDVYALGAVLYQLLTGSRPFESLSRLDVIQTVVKDAPPSPESLCPQIPAALATICKRAMAREPSARYHTARELADEVLRFQSGAVVASHDYGLREHVLRFVKKHRPAVMTAVVAAVLLVCVVTYSMLTLRDGRATERALRLQSDQERYDLSIALAQRSLGEFQYDEVNRILEESPLEYRGWEWGHLYYLSQLRRQSYEGHPGRLAAMDLSPTGEHVVTLDFSGAALLWSLPEMDLMRTYTVDSEGWAVAFHPKGNEFATTGLDGRIRRWGVETGALLADYQAPGDSASALAYTPDGAYLLSAGTDEGISQWELATGTVLRKFPAPYDINGLTISPNGEWLAAGDDHGMVRLWDWETATPLWQHDGHSQSQQQGVQGTVYVSFSPDSRWLASSGTDATAKVWESTSGSLQHTFDDFLTRVWSARFSPDGETLTTTTRDRVSFWDLATGEEGPTWIKGEGITKQSRYLPDGTQLLTVGGSEHVRGWELAPELEGRYLEGHHAEVNGVRFSPDGTWLASTGGHWKEGGDGRVLLWQPGRTMGNGSATAHHVLEGGQRWTHPLAFHPDGKEVSAGDNKGYVLTWDLASGALTGRHHIPEYTNGVRCLAYHPDGARIVTAGWGGDPLPTISEWSSATGQLLRRFSGATDTIDSVAFSDDGRYLAAGCRDGSAYVWDAIHGQLIHRLTEGDGWVYGVAFSPDGKYLATSHNRALVLLWDLESGALVQQFHGLHGRAGKVCFSPDGRRIAACDVSSVKVWGVATGAVLLSLPHGANDVSFSPDGLTLATAGADGRVGVWHALPWD